MINFLAVSSVAKPATTSFADFSVMPEINVPIIAWVVIILFILFLVGREVVLWYWRINDMADSLKDMADSLRKIAKDKEETK